MTTIAVTERSYTQSFMRELVFVIFYKKKLIIWPWLAFFAFAIVMAFTLPPVYSSSAKFIISAGGNQLDPLQQNRDFDLKNMMVRIIQNQKEIVYSAAVLGKAARALAPNADPSAIEHIIGELKSTVQFTPPKGESFEGSNVFYLTYEDEDPARAKDITTVLADGYLEETEQLSHSKSEYSYDFYKQQVSKLQEIVQRKGAKLREYETANASTLIDILNLDSGKSNLEVGPRALIQEANRNRQQLQIELIGTSLLIERLEAGLRDNDIPLLLPEMEVSGRVISTYRNKVAQLQLQINELSTQYTESFAPRQELTKELALSVNLLRKEVKNYIDAKRVEQKTIQGKLNEIDTQIIKYQASLSETAVQRSTYEAIKQEYTIANQAYTDALTKMEQARLASSIAHDVQNITIVEKPQFPFRPVKPHRFMLVVLGLIGGGFVGLAIALVSDFFDHTIKSPEDIERWLEVPTLGSISHIRI